MTLNEMTKMFLYSRKIGLDGARWPNKEKTISIYRDNLGLFSDFMAQSCSVSDYTGLEKNKLRSFFEWMDEKVKNKQWSESTKLQILRSLKAFFRWVDRDEECKERGLHGVQRWLPEIKKNPRRMDMPETSEVRKFINSFDTGNRWHYRNYVASCLMLTNGIRIGELCNLTVGCTKLEDRLLIVTGKTNTRTVPITKEMVGLLKGWLKRRKGCRYEDSPYVFVSREGPKMHPSSFVDAFLAHRKKYGLTRISAHSFRHVFCTNYLKQGGRIEKLKRITGHSSYDMLEDYLHDAEVASKETHEELERVNILKEM